MSRSRLGKELGVCLGVPGKGNEGEVPEAQEPGFFPSVVHCGWMMVNEKSRDMG